MPAAGPSPAELRQAAAMIDLAAMLSSSVAKDADWLGRWWFQWRWFTERAAITAQYQGDVELWISEALA